MTHDPLSVMEADHLLLLSTFCQNACGFWKSHLDPCLSSLPLDLAAFFMESDFHSAEAACIFTSSLICFVDINQ